MGRIRLISLALALIGFGVLVVLVIGPAEPSHQGKPLSFWLEEIGYKKPEARQEEARQAIRAIGTNAIPWLIAVLRIDEPRWKRIVKEWMAKQSIIKVKYRTPDARSFEAARAFHALGAKGSPAIPELVKLLDRNPGHVPAALSWIGADAVPALTNALTHTNLHVRANAVEALANAVSVGGIPRSAAAAAVPIWLEQLKDNDAGLRYHAAWGLGIIRSRAALCIPALIQSLDDPVSSVQSASAKSLQDFGPAASSAVPRLINLFSSPDSSIRQAVAGALGAIGDARAVTVLVSGIRDPSDSVRIWAVDALGSIEREPKVTVPALIDALRDPNPMVRLKAAEGLCHFRTDALVAIETLRKLAANDPDLRVRSMADHSLRFIGSGLAPQ